MELLHRPNSKVPRLPLANPVPIDTRAFPILSGSPLAIDYYLWFARTMFSLKKSRLVTWAELHGQFGSAYDFTDKRGRHNFRAESKKQIETRVSVAYPTLQSASTRKGRESSFIRPRRPYRPLQRKSSCRPDSAYFYRTQPRRRNNVVPGEICVLLQSAYFYRTGTRIS